MTALTDTRETLAKGLHDARCGSRCGRPGMSDIETADALIASGKVHVVGDLADDDALVEAVADVSELARWEVRAVLAALAAHLNGGRDHG
jgi:hypothetical protein